MGFPFAPKNWLYCQGQILPIAPNQALFSLLGTTYGGDGRTTFALPDLRGRAIVGQGEGPGLSPYAWGQRGGTEGVTITPDQMPVHQHNYTGTLKTAPAAEANEPAGGYPAPGTALQFSTGTPNGTMGSSTVAGTTANAGNSQPHDNRQPLIGMNYAIALTGDFPSRG